jgi:putative membrane protein
MQALVQSIGGVGAFAAYFFSSVVLLAALLRLYIAIIPYREIALIRAGNRAAACSLGGAIIGFAIPMGKAVSQSKSITDMLVWTVFAFIAQLIAYIGAALCVPHFRKTIEDDHVASGIILAALSISIGILNAASMTD